jgi:NAD(P)-dependent dehydrogenase (short-subunit alcohol dehydrogenase family)
LLSAYSYQFVKCDVRQWKEQVDVFKDAIANSPNKSVDIVIANAGISADDPFYKLGLTLLS